MCGWSALEEVEEERWMLRVAELWREERVQMKLADAQVAMEEKLREIDGAVAELHEAPCRPELDTQVAMEEKLREIDGVVAELHEAPCRPELDTQVAMEEKLREIDGAVAELHAAAAIGSGSNNSSCCSNSSPVGKSSPSRSQHCQQSPSRSHQHGQLQRQDAGGGSENLHIRRGIKGFVEFPKAVRVAPPREERVDLVSNLECQRAQLRVLMRHWNPAAGMGLIGAAENLVV